MTLLDAESSNHVPLQSNDIYTYLLQPKMGGAHQTAAHTHENIIPPEAHLASNLTFPKGLHTTTHLSQEMIVRDHRAAIPVEIISHDLDSLTHRKLAERI